MPDGGVFAIRIENTVIDSKFAQLHPDIKLGPYILIEFSDQGVGIDQENLDKIFDPFFTTKGQKGTGLGLAVIWGIIDNHNGHIEVDSTQGEGTTFTIMLPV